MRRRRSGGWQRWRRRVGVVVTLVIFVAVSAACGPSASPPPPPQDPVAAAATRGRLVAVVMPALDALVDAATQLHDGAPSSDRGWDPVRDAAAIDAMKRAWFRAHDAWEHAEVAVEPLFAEDQLGLDGRYELFMTSGERERDPFDSRIVVGLHAVERILWFDAIPSYVQDFESGIPLGFAAAIPANADQSRNFATKLSNRLMAESAEVRDRFASKLDLGLVFGGLVASLAEQRDDVDKRATGQDESRYAQRSMTDLRACLEGARAVYGAYRPWLVGRPGGPALDAEIAARFAELAAVYAAVEGDALPPAPPRWSRLHPTDEQLATPFGRLFAAAARAADASADGSLAHDLNAAALALGLPAYPEDP